MPTPDQQRLIDAIARRLDAEPGVEALWLAGSLGGGGDAFSDVDLLVLAADGAAGEVSARLARDLARAMRVVLVNSLFGGRVLNMVTADWARFDLTIVQA
jgi:predicted nucleotidyltransferase